MHVFSFSISLNICLGAQKNRLNETVLLSPNNICYSWKIKKKSIIHSYLEGLSEYRNYAGMGESFQDFKADWQYKVCLKIQN